MRLQVVGTLGWDYPQTGYRETWSNMARELQLAEGFAAAGHSVWMKSASTALDRVGVAVRPAFRRDADWTVIVSQGLHQLSSWRGLTSGRVVSLADIDHKWDLDLTWIDILAFSSGTAALDAAARYGRHVNVVPWACPTFVASDLVDPFPSRKGAIRVIYVGTLYGRYIARINALAESTDLEIWIGGVTDRGGETARYRGMTDLERSHLLHPRVHLLSDILRGDDLTREHLRVFYGEQFPFYAHADVGLCFCSDNMPAAKIYDMLAYGLPVVTEDGRSNVQDVVTVNGGSIVPHDDFPAFLAAVRSVGRRPRDPTLGHRAIQILGTWRSRADTLLDLMKQCSAPSRCATPKGGPGE